MLRALRQIISGAIFGALIATQALGQTATLLPNAKQQFFTPQGIPAASGTVDMYIPSTTTRKTTWKSSTESVGNQNTNPVLLDAGGYAVIYGDGQYRQVVKDSSGNTIWDAVTASTGGGSGPTPGPTVGDGNIVGTILPWAGLVAPPNYVFAYGQAISRSAYPLFTSTITIVTSLICTASLNVLSGISDTTQIRVGAPVEASCVSPGTTVIGVAPNAVVISSTPVVSTAATATFFPFGNGDGSTTFNVPDLRGQALAGRDNMGGTARGSLTSTYFGTQGPDSLGATGGTQSQTLVLGNLPPYTPAGSISVTSTDTNIWAGTIPTNNNAAGGSGAGITSLVPAPAATARVSTGTLVGTAQGGTSTAFSLVQPTITMNYVIKVLPDASTTVATGVASLGGMTGVIACGTNLVCSGNTISSFAGTVSSVTSADGLATISPTTGVVQVSLAPAVRAQNPALSSANWWFANAGNLTGSGTQNVGIGPNANAAVTTGADSVSIGFNAMSGNTLGSNDVAVGTSALAANSGEGNTAVGTQSAFRNTTGIGLGCLAINSCQQNTTGTFNTGIGDSALLSNRGGNHNTGIGDDSLTGAGSGSIAGNVGIGSNTGFSITTGNNNFFGGLNSGFGETTGSENVAVGHSSLFNNQFGNENVAIGHLALQNVGPASSVNTYNTAIGSGAGTGITTGINNTILGANTNQTIGSGVVLIATGDGNPRADYNYTNASLWTFSSTIVLLSMPTSCSGKPTGTLWNNSGVVNVC